MVELPDGVKTVTLFRPSAMNGPERRVGEWTTDQREVCHLGEEVQTEEFVAVSNVPAIEAAAVERVREELLSDAAKGALYDADRRYQNVDPREQSEDGWATALLEAALTQLAQKGDGDRG
jgi:uncharacterized sporulation protein YeaH/YhbH (DUF444 family)